MIVEDTKPTYTFVPSWLKNPCLILNFALWFFAFDFADTGTSGQSAFTTRIILEPQPGDLAADGVVDSKDLARLISKWLWTGEPGGISEDIIEDGYVDFLDFAALAGNWMK